jgi:hypothetical protein
MAAFGLFLLVIFLLVGWLLCLVYRETEQDFPPAHHCHVIRVPVRMADRAQHFR